MEKRRQKTPTNFIVKKCDFKCSKKGDYNRHLLSRKHNISTDGNNDSKKHHMYVKICNKEYKDRTGLMETQKEVLHYSRGSYIKKFQ